MAFSSDTMIGITECFWTLVPEGRWLYAILDAARDGVIVEKPCSMQPEFDLLYRGRADQILWEVAPYLVRLDKENEFCWWLFEAGQKSAPDSLSQDEYAAFRTDLLPSSPRVGTRYLG